ncbi:MAG: ThiF family adenylyltransferase [Bradyrhizobium sp.]|nr:ThiF family adenylyltransferase [Bradyrhizobium sp.]
MSRRPINRSPDLRKLQAEGYDLEIRSGYLLVKSVPYVNASRLVRRGTLIIKLVLANDITCQPDNHVAYFSGEYPCDQHGIPIEQFRHGTPGYLADGVTADFSFSAKPKPKDNYDDYYHKISAYVGMLGGPAQVLDPTATALTHPFIPASEDDWVFHYLDNASSRADIGAVTAKLALSRVAIIGLGGTGAYVLDLVAKTPVQEIHLFDGDTFLQHNAFRSPGAASGGELEEKLPKVTYFGRIYSKMRRGIVEHPNFVRGDDIDALRAMDFIFICMDRPREKALIVSKLEEFGKPFVDVGMGLYLTRGALGGIVRTTTGSIAKRDHLRSRIPMRDGDDDENEYSTNIQIADLNALNAAFAVIKWKKLFGFYHDQEHEFSSSYTIGGNDLLNEDQHEA